MTTRIAYGVVRRNRGAITVESQPGVGTTFRLLFPLTEQEVRPAAAGRERHTRHGSETLLVVEDEPAVRRLLRRTLEQGGYRVIVAEDGQHGLIAAESHGDEIDLLLSDLIMPRMGGAELARRLVAQRPGLRVLFLSGYSRDRVDGETGPVPGARLLQKPFALEDLLAEVRSALDA